MATDLFEGFRSHAARYALAAFAVGVGIMAFALLVLIVEGLKTRIDAMTEEFGADVVSIVRESPLGGSRRGLSVSHVEVILANYPELAAVPMRYFTSQVLGERDPLNVIATGPELVSIRDWTIIEGRNLDATDVRGKARVLVASRRLAEAGEFRAGNVVFVGREPFFVVGVVDASSTQIEAGQSTGPALTGERFVLMPWSTAPAWQGESDETGRRVEQVLIRGGDAGTLARSLRRLFMQSDIDAGHVSFITAQRLVADIQRLQRVVMLSVGAVALLCLLLGGTTLMSLMVVNVRERLAEIGLRISLGARRAQISTLFVVEAIVVAAMAGIAGTIAAHSMAELVGTRLVVALEPSWNSVLAPTAVAIILGTVFSWWPARLAARITPAEAIRAD